MQIVDANVLIYAVNKDTSNHDAAREWLSSALTSGRPVGFPVSVLLAFCRVTTMPTVFDKPLTADQAFEVIDAWLAFRSATVIHPGPRHLQLMRTVLQDVGAAGNLVNDAHMAALALEYKAELMSFDRDFGRFAGVRHRVPDAAS